MKHEKTKLNGTENHIEKYWSFETRHYIDDSFAALFSSCPLKALKMLQTHRNFFYIFLLTLTISFCRVDGARILGVFPHLAKSHFIMDEVLMKGLAARGHEVVVISHFPQSKPVANYKDISLIGSMDNIVESLSLDMVGGGTPFLTLFGNPDNPAYTPVHFLAHSDKMNFYERLLNTVALVPIKLGYKYLVGYKSEQVARKYFGDSLPPLEEIARNMSLHLVNTHFSLFHPRPFVPAVVEVGGIHLGEPKKLSKEFAEFLDGAKHGVIYLSLGSTVRSDSFPEEKRLGLLQAFAQLPQKVLWKWEADHMPDKPDNVKIAKWMPQLEILSHPKVKVFITHGGLMGTMEAAYFGVPMVAIPLFGDQKMNVKTFVDKGIAVKLDYNEISKEAVLGALRMVLEDPSYSENAKQVARAFRDRPLSAMDTAIYWIEYIIRHKGAHHLRSAAADLPCNGLRVWPDWASERLKYKIEHIGCNKRWPDWSKRLSVHA
ncbi:unnamed protein product [Timema podura]|uniref:UDP-glucuronosyltransferase n=1 Tax=Timema podura TaxID=61482 RepID=A0ABN7NWJ3_TIMPD|nr:unnamed protein product [Timema podura]